jgi:hypothetical protein
MSHTVGLGVAFPVRLGLRYGPNLVGLLWPLVKPIRSIS